MSTLIVKLRKFQGALSDLGDYLGGDMRQNLQTLENFINNQNSLNAAVTSWFGDFIDSVDVTSSDFVDVASLKVDSDGSSLQIGVFPNGFELSDSLTAILNTGGTSVLAIQRNGVLFSQYQVDTKLGSYSILDFSPPEGSVEYKLVAKVGTASNVNFTNMRMMAKEL